MAACGQTAGMQFCFTSPLWRSREAAGGLNWWSTSSVSAGPSALWLIPALVSTGGGQWVWRGPSLLYRVVSRPGGCASCWFCVSSYVLRRGGSSLDPRQTPHLPFLSSLLLPLPDASSAAHLTYCSVWLKRTNRKIARAGRAGRPSSPIHLPSSPIFPSILCSHD